ncbi:MAG: SpoIIE family protein phosphatase [Leptospiraceae bacterium]|nr:SpoIIE family protein phosphatase [Leptospiraceae bacterium]
MTFLQNYYVVALFTNSLVMIITSVFFGLIPNKSSATRLFSNFAMMGGITSLGYIVSQGMLEPIPYGRLVSLIVILYLWSYSFKFTCNFPERIFPRAENIIFALEIILSTILSIVFIYKSINSKMDFDFYGQFYEFQLPSLNKIYIAFVLLLLISNILSLVIHLFFVKKENRKYVFIALIAYLLIGLLPGVMAGLNKAGAISRGVYITVYCLGTILGFFILTILYINKTTDKTTFMFKIVGIGFVMFMLIFSLSSYFILNDKDDQYSELKNAQIPSIVKNDIRTEDLVYLSEYSISDHEFQIKLSSPDYQINSKDIEAESLLAVVYEKFKILEEGENPGRVLESIQALNITNLHVLPYIQTLEEILSSDPGGTDLNFKKMNQIIEKKNYSLFKAFNKIRWFSNEKFSVELDKYFEKTDPEIVIFRDHIIKFIESNPEMEGSLQKSEVLQFLNPLQEFSKRKFRKNLNSENIDSVISYHFIDGEKVYEIGFSYKEYRKYIDHLASILTYILFASLILFLVGSPIFLGQSLLTPLNLLLQGLEKVEKGNLDIQLRVKVQDEIGFLTSSFNKMVESIRISKEKLEEYSNQLEDKVEERTKELVISLGHVEKLKSQQDGDYFLTTLLLKPLSVNRVKDARMVIQFLLKQKKEFQFRNTKYEIGGDICISEEINLRKKKYIAFLNADAMGKSIQGAGGILVLGSVFQSIIQRTMSDSFHKTQYPEQWIKSAFEEMHKIFESFEGSMLVSLIFGLVDDETGMFYYINAEHPWLILYRDGVAEFLENDLYFRKLGTSGIEQDLFISTYQILPGDTLIMGSDGKDDLVLEKETNEKGRVINEDETLFLRTVEETAGDIDKMYSKIKNNYELMDDFSLLSIHYPMDERIIQQESENMELYRKVISEAKAMLSQNNIDGALDLLLNEHKKNPNNLEIEKSLIKLYMKRNRYEEAARVCEEYIERNELDTSMMLKTSYCFKINREFDKAIEIGERIKLREPYNIRNLVHLSDMYIYTQNFIRAEKLIYKILAIDPENSQGKVLLEGLKKKLELVQTI